MNPKAALPALVPLAAAAPALAVGAAIGLGLIWLFSDDKKPATANAKAGNEPPQPDAQRTGSGGIVEDLEREWGMRDDPKPETRKQGTGWFFFDDEPAAAPAVAEAEDTRLFPTIIGSSEEAEAQRAREAEAQRQQRIRDNEAALVRERRKLEAAQRKQRKLQADIEAVRTVTQPASPPPAASQPPATPAASPQTTMAAATAPAADNPGRFQLKPRKYDPAHLEAVLKAGPLPRNAVVKALKAAPFNYGHTLAYTTLQRFSDLLEETPTGLLAWKGAN